MLKTEKWLHFVETVGVFMHYLAGALMARFNLWDSAIRSVMREG